MCVVSPISKRSTAPSPSPAAKGVHSSEATKSPTMKDFSYNMYETLYVLVRDFA